MAIYYRILLYSQDMLVLFILFYLLQRLGTQPATKCWYRPAKDLKPWLQGFVNMVGQDEAERLLEGVGRVHSWPKYHASRTAAAPTNNA